MSKKSPTNHLHLHEPRDHGLRRHGCGLAALALFASLASCGPDSLSPAGGALTRGSSAPVGDRTVTLITGDRVTLTGRGDATNVEVEPGPGRGHIGFMTLQHGDQVHVIPQDVVSLIAADRLDRALFDVTQLLAAGYGDRQRGDLPLIVTGGDVQAARARMATAGVTVHRTMPAFGALAVRQDKASGGAILAQLGAGASAGAVARGAPAAGPAPHKIWLDAVRKPLLDRSVAQIGAPAVHARGFTGAGVVVAVLDSGIDTGHPDLAGKVVDAREFVDDGLGTSDVAGHGSHVASIVAGSGAASDGRFRGVAPDAALLNARVCDAFGCPVSAMLAGMEWAVVDKGARIVNISIGGIDEPGEDPLEQAVNQLSAERGALFVIAAGNDGLDASVNSPGSADAALTVGAVDVDDVLADFSSRGPRTGDGAIKPDLTAPGVDITAARADLPEDIGVPVGPHYMLLSGTSMATPHVAGAAALLLQEHPAWTGVQLKAALIASARPVAGTSAFAQGAGRVDVDRASRQQVTAEPGSASFGVPAFPHHDDPIVSRTVTYSNTGPAPVTLALAASLALPDQRAAPPGMLALSATEVTVPAGGTASVVLTVDTNRGGPDGLYAGHLVASSGDVRVVTAIGVNQEIEAYNLRLEARGRDGGPAFTFLTLWPVGTGGLRVGDVTRLIFDDGEFTLRLPRGSYRFSAFMLDDVGPGAMAMARPRLDLFADTTVALDGQRARPVVLAVPGVALTLGRVRSGLTDVAHGFTSFVTSNELLTAQVGPDAGPEEIDSTLVTSAVPRTQPGVPEVYSFGRRELGRFFTGWQQTIARRELATVLADHAGEAGVRYRKTAFAQLDGGPLTSHRGESTPTDHEGAFRRTEHYFGAGLVWQPTWVQQSDAAGEVVRLETVRRYARGELAREAWNRAPFGPALAEPVRDVPNPPSRDPAATRTGDVLTLDASMFSDRDSPARAGRSATIRERTVLLRDGQPLFAFDLAPEFPNFPVPPEPATYRFERSSARGPDPVDGSPLFDLSTEVSAAWTFRSARVPSATPLALPLLSLRFQPALDDDNRAIGRVTLLPIAIERIRGAAAPRIASITADASFDDGATWSQIPVVLLGDRALGVVVHPAGAVFASLRGTARDVDGNQVETTIVRAYRLDRRR